MPMETAMSWLGTAHVVLVEVGALLLLVISIYKIIKHEAKR